MSNYEQQILVTGLNNKSAIYSLYLDDEREPKATAPYGNWKIARSVSQAWQYINMHGVPSYISFDHDLGENRRPGYDFAKGFARYLEYCPENLIHFRSFNVHSANPVGAKNIQCYMENALKHLAETYKVEN